MGAVKRKGVVNCPAILIDLFAPDESAMIERTSNVPLHFGLVDMPPRPREGPPRPNVFLRAELAV